MPQTTCINQKIKDKMDQNKIKNTIGQLEKALSDAATIMSNEEFEEYSDNTYALISKWRIVLMRDFLE